MIAPCSLQTDNNIGWIPVPAEEALQHLRRWGPSADATRALKPHIFDAPHLCAVLPSVLQYDLMAFVALHYDVCSHPRQWFVSFSSPHFPFG